MDKILIGVVTAACGSLITFLMNRWTTARAVRAARQAELRVQADALLVAAVELRALYESNRLLWEGWKERGRSFLLAALTGTGELARGIMRSPTAHSALHLSAALGTAAETLSVDRLAAKQAIAAVTPAITRMTSAAAPLLRHTDPDVAQAASRLLTAARDVDNPEAADAAASKFMQTVSHHINRPRGTARLVTALRPARSSSPN